MKKVTKRATGVLAILTPFITLSNIGLSSCGHKNITYGHILTFNDFHGADVGYGDYGKDGYPLDVSYKNPGVERLAYTINNFKKENPNTVVLSGGDNATDDAFGSCTHGQSVFELNKALGVPYSALGNHAWEWEDENGNDLIDKYDQWGRIEGKTQGHYFISSNVLNGEEFRDDAWETDPKKPEFQGDFKKWNENRLQNVDPYKLIDVDGHSICLIGLTTIGATSDGNRKFVDHLSFIDYDASINYTKYLLKQSQPEKYDAIESFILLTHVESYYDEDTSQPILDTSKPDASTLAYKLTSNVDAIISAHSHKKGCGKIHNPILNKDIWVGQAETAGRCLLDTKLTFDENKPKGEKLTDVSMNVQKVSIDYGQHDPQSTEALECAAQELKKIREEAKQQPNGNELKQTVKVFAQKEKEIKDTFEKETCPYKTQGEAFPYSKHREILGHKYVWPSHDPTDPAGDYGAPDMVTLDNNYIIDEAGAWLNYHALQGFNQTLLTSELKAPSISFIYFDSITGEILSDKKVITGDLYQMLSHDDKTIYGYVTLGQLCNIIDYILAGEDAFIYGKDNNNVYVTDVKRNQPQDETGLNYDPITGSPCVTELDFDKNATKSVYLPGPIQFWGMRFEVEKHLVEIQDQPGSYTRRFRLKYDSNNNPLVYIYDVDDTSQTLSNPQTWKQWPVDKLIPVVVNSFAYIGGNGQACMFKPYLEYCAKEHEVISGVEYTNLMRELILTNLGSIQASSELDITKASARHVVEFSE